MTTIIVEGLLLDLVKDGFKKVLSVGWKRLTGGDIEMVDLAEGQPSAVLKVRIRSDVQDPARWLDDLRVELIFQGTEMSRGLRLLFGEPATVRVPRDDYLVTALIFYVGAPGSLSGPFLAGCGQVSVNAASGRPQPLVVPSLSPAPADAMALGFADDRIFYKGRPIEPLSRSSRRRMQLTMRQSQLGGGGLTAAEQDELRGMRAADAVERRARTRETKRAHGAVPTCGARTRSGLPCQDPVVDAGLCRNHLEKVQAGGIVVWEATGKPVSL